MKTGRRFAPEGWVTDPETGRFDPERPDDFGRNHWTASAGMTGRIGRNTHQGSIPVGESASDKSS